MSRLIRGEAEFSNSDIARFLLEMTNTLEPPTDAEQVADHLNLNIRGFFHSEYNLDSNIRAYLWPAKKEIGISNQLSPHRRKFSILHEVGHFVLPGHLDNIEKEAMLLDDARSLSDFSVVTVETEANRFAADCIFQLNRFQDDVSNVSLEWASISRMANVYDASLVSTARRWIKESLGTCALLVFVPLEIGEIVTLNYSYSITSQTFRQKYFARLSKFTFGEGSEVFRAFRDTRGYADLVETLHVDIDNDQYAFDMMLFSTQFGVYGLIVK